MKNEKGLGHIGTILLIILITLLVSGAVYFVRMQYTQENFESLKTNMLLVQAKVKKIEGEYKLSKKEEDLKGTPIKEMQEDEIIQKFLEKQVIDLKEKDAKFYVLTQNDLDELEIKVTLPKETYYIVNYSNGEVMLTKGYTRMEEVTYYTLTQIEAISKENENETEKQEETPKQKEENTDSKKEDKAENKEKEKEAKEE